MAGGIQEEFGDRERKEGTEAETRYALKTESTTGGSNASVLRRMVTSAAKGKVGRASRW